MKKGYKKLLVFESIILILLIINSFAINFLSGYRISILLAVILIISKFLFGFEKDRHRYIKDFILEEIIIIITFLILYYLSGILFGFTRSDYININGLTKFILPTAGYVILREIFRYMCLCKSEGNKLLTVLSVAVIAFMDITDSIYFFSISTVSSIYIFIALYVLPAILNNISYSYISKNIGYKPVLFYCLVIELYPYLLPIVPDPGQYINAIFLVVLPGFLGYRAYKFFEFTKESEIKREYYKRKNSIKSLIVFELIVACLVYFLSGLFDYWAIAIASGSMAKRINRGDVVIVHKVKDNFDSLNTGQILAYRYNDKIIVHRIVDKIQVNNEVYYRTKGDANKDIDNVIIEEDMIVGTVELIIPFIGLPTVWINS